MTEPLPEGHRRAHNNGAPWKGGVLQEDWMTGFLVLRLGRELRDAGEALTRIDRSGAVVAEEARDTFESDNIIRIPIDLARVLNDALNRHFGGSGDSRTLRKDFEHERDRVDRLMEKLTSPVYVLGGEVSGR